MSFFISSNNISFVGDKGLLNYLGFSKDGKYAIAILVYIVSLLLSIKLYENRDL